MILKSSELGTQKLALNTGIGWDEKYLLWHAGATLSNTAARMEQE